MKIMSRFLIIMLCVPMYLAAVDTIEVELVNESKAPVLVSTNHVQGGSFKPLVYKGISEKYILLTEGKNNFFYFSTPNGIHSLSRIGDNGKYGKDRWSLAVQFPFLLVREILVEDLQSKMFSNKIKITIQEGDKLPAMKL